MAKLTAPLFSFTARGQLAKSLVYFPWKGLNCVRQHVVPTNPRSADQLTQRGYFEDGVDEFHNAGYTDVDKSAWNRFALILEAVMSGFNAMIRSFVNEAVAGGTWERMHNLQLYGPTGTTIECDVGKAAGGNAPTLHWGTSRTWFPESGVMADIGGGYWRLQMAGLTSGVLYYVYADVGTPGVDYGRTGVYQQRTT